MAVHPYLFFSGTCRQAFTRYEEIFGGKLEMMPASDAPEGQWPGEPGDYLMHAALTFGDNVLMGSDDPTGDGGPMKGMAISLSADDPSEAERVFNALADGGEVTMPLAETFWSPLFGMCNDRFGVPWMVDVGAPAPA
ncbi:MAG TPA: VOC family protein [Egibacteraceae bacterium]|nr:VOC family protein [Egibacteraceae bacterium]